MNAQHQQQLWEIDNLPNRLTFFRIILVPVVIFCLSIQLIPQAFAENYHALAGWIAGWTFVLASITDWVDGYIARKRNLVTMFGSFLDPIADKFLVVSSLIMLQSLGRIPALLVIILVLREMYITSLRLLAQDQGISVPVSNLGKWKTTTQMIGIPLLMPNTNFYDIPLPIIGTIMIYIASFLSVYSALQYSLGLVKKLKAKKMEKLSNDDDTTATLEDTEEPKEDSGQDS